MIAIDDVLISDEIVEAQFVCDLNKCKGGCCVEGDAGAPITEAEAATIAALYPKVKPMLSPRSVALIEAAGTHAQDDEFGLVTPTLDEGICAYGYYDESGIVKCAFEQLYHEGKSDFKKPLSCHLYPIRIAEGDTFELLNFEPRKKLCRPACKLGKSLKVPVYQFLKEPLIRKYGVPFYESLEATVRYQQTKEGRGEDNESSPDND